MKSGDEVIIKFVKQANSKVFSKEVKRMRNWLKIIILFSPRLRKVGNPLALINHVADYTLRELDLRNEIKGAEELMKIQKDISKDFPTPLLKFPKYYPELSNENVLVSEFIDGDSLEDGIEKSHYLGILCSTCLEFTGHICLELELFTETFTREIVL